MPVKAGSSKPSPESLQYRKIVRRYLKKLTAKLRQQLMPLASKERLAGEELVFEVHSDAFYDNLFACVFVVNSTTGETSPGKNVLPGVKGIFPRSHRETEEGFDEKGVNTGSAATAELIEWFAACWNDLSKSGRPKAAIQHHDSIKYFDLTRSGSAGFSLGSNYCKEKLS